MSPFSLPILLFDAECTFCTRFKQGLEFLDRDKTISFVSLQTPEIYLDFPQLSPEQCKQSIHFINKDGVIFKGAEAAQELIKYYPGVSKLGWLLESDQGKKAVDFFYHKVTEMKDKLAKGCNTCGHD